MVTFAFCASIGVRIKFEINVVSATNTALRNIIVDLHIVYKTLNHS